MAESVVSFCVERISELLIQEMTVSSGVRSQVEMLRSELEMIQSFLKDANNRQDDVSVRNWVSAIREIAYDGEDVIEAFALKISSRRRRGFQNAFKRFALIINESIELHRLGSEINALKTRLNNLSWSLQRYGIRIQPRSEEGTSSSSEMQRKLMRQSYSHFVDEYTVGLEKDEETLVAQLVNEDKSYGVVSIWGMGGLGKTTLARKVYHHSAVRRHFDALAWVFVSQQFQTRFVWEKILFDIVSLSKEEREEIKRMTEYELAQKLIRIQLEKKCLLVLDGIWSPEAWNSLSPALAVGSAGSKILLTTRNKAVTEHVGGFLREVQCLNEKDSWELFKKKAFPGNSEPDFKISEEMELLGRKMLERCHGLPLAIVMLGGLLSTKPTWDNIEDVNSFLRRDESNKQGHSVVADVLALSYHELPYQLKPCFLHLGHFPEDYDIPTKKLIRIWVSEGIVSSHRYEEVTLEDVAEDYVGELLNRGMVQVGVRGSSGRVKTCRLHSSMRDLCCSKSDLENFLKTFKSQNGNEPIVTIRNLSPRNRRLAVYLSDETYGSLSGKHEGTPNLRSLLFFSTDRYGARISQKMIGRFSDCILLKVLDLESCYIAGKLTRAIGTLINLRYLSLNCSLITNIPSSIGNLRLLETLILQTYWSVEIGVPNMIWKMEKLKHLYLPTYVKKRSGKLLLGNSSNLQTLQGFDARACDAKELIKFTNLKKLGISHLKRFEEVEDVLASSRVTFNGLRSLNISVNSTIEKTDLQGLFSSCRNLHKLTLGGQIEKLPEDHEFPSGLIKLTLRNSHLEEDPMATLEKLPQLRILYLRVGSFVGKNMVCSSEGFPQLKSLVLSYFHDLEEWKVDEKAMPNLCELVIENCMKLKMVPEGLRFIPTLRELKILNMPIAFRRRLQEGDDKRKVQHVPSIIFK